MAASIGAVVESHGIDAARGFLPEDDPLEAFPLDRFDPAAADYLATFDRLAESLSDRLAAGTLRSATRALERPPVDLIDELTVAEAYRLCTITSFLASGHVHQLDTPTDDRLPPGVAVPLHRVSTRLGRQPIAAYDTICLHNFRQHGDGFAVEHLEPVVTFTDLDDEAWFVAIHVAIEAAAGPALVACASMQDHLASAETDQYAPETLERLAAGLTTVAASLEEQTAIMERMTEGNDPMTFATEFRPYYDGFPGVVFEGVSALDGTPQALRGGSGAQSSVLPSIDAALGIDHEGTALIEKLADMHSYMPKHHREVLAAYRSGPDLRPVVASSGHDRLIGAFNRCVDGLAAFRKVHFEQVAQYIRAVTGDTTGTGGTDFMPFLRQLQAETEAQRV